MQKEESNRVKVTWRPDRGRTTSGCGGPLFGEIERCLWSAGSEGRRAELAELGGLYWQNQRVSEKPPNLVERVERPRWFGDWVVGHLTEGEAFPYSLFALSSLPPTSNPSSGKGAGGPWEWRSFVHKWRRQRPVVGRGLALVSNR